MKFDKSYEEVVLFQCREILKLQLFCDIGKKITFE